jgi:hypothetical protein
MKKVLTIILLFACMSLCGQKGKFVMCNWYTFSDLDPGLPDESYEYFKKGKLFYCLSNDDDNIYVDIKIEDSGVQSRILQEGMTVWLNMDNKKNKKAGVGIHYPIGARFSRDRNIGNQGSPLAQANTIELVGFTDTVVNRFPAKNSDNFTGSVRYNQEGNLFYHLAIPLTKLPERIDEAMLFTLGIEYGAAPVTARPAVAGMPQASSGRSSAGPPGGGSRGGGRPGGAPGGGIPPSGSGTSQATVPPVILWINNIRLAATR